ncbi:MAG: hypothetical protein ACYTFW_05155 [Planctomycetota bacterium]|jgi:hypothetical protein
MNKIIIIKDDPEAMRERLRRHYARVRADQWAQIKETTYEIKPESLSRVLIPKTEYIH